MTKKKSSLIELATSDRLRQIFDLLNDEETPFEVRIKKADKGRRLVIIYVNSCDMGHFMDLLYDNTEI